MRMIVATHKAADVPADDFYLPVHVGHELNPVDLGYQGDDDGKNISALNRSYCELTALYWAWQNLDAEIIGLSHYRRYFVGNQPGPGRSRILSGDEAALLLQRHDIVLGRRRNYVIETIESHYRHAHHGSDLEILRAVISEMSPDYLEAYDAIFGGRMLSLYNMFLMRRRDFDRYAAWLFPALEATAKEIGDVSHRTHYQQRTFGYLGERLLNVWVAGNPQLRLARRTIVNTDGEPKFRKAVNLAKRKAGLADPWSRAG